MVASPGMQTRCGDDSYYRPVWEFHKLNHRSTAPACFRTLPFPAGVNHE
jgi:hypothetical protein